MNAPSKAQEIKAFLAAGVAFLTALWGWVGWIIFLLIAAIVLDYITGTAAAKATGEWTSKMAREGLWHKLGEIVALLVAALCDIAISVILHTGAAQIFEGLPYGNYITLVVATWYFFTEVGSILENIKKLGAPIPEWLISGARVLKGKAEEAAPIAGAKEDGDKG
jgi:toxin secretion/phage lysis holin